MSRKPHGKGNIKKRVYGWIELYENRTQNGKARHEIDLAADYIGKKTVAETLTTLMHKMVPFTMNRIEI